MGGEEREGWEVKGGCERSACEWREGASAHRAQPRNQLVERKRRTVQSVCAARERTGECGAPFNEWNHIETRAIMHLSSVLRSRPKCSKVFSVVPNITPRAPPSIISPRGRRTHVAQDVVDGPVP